MTMPLQPFDSTEAAPSGSADGRRLAWGLVAVTLFALGVRLYHLDYESLWYDELTQVMTYHLPVTYVVPAAAGHGQPPLDYLIGVALDRSGLSASDWWVRLPAASFGTVSVLLCGLLVKRVAGGLAGIGAALLLAVCPLHVVMSQEARPYTIFVCFALAAVLGFENARRRHTPVAWALFALCTWAMLMSRWVGPNFVVLGLGVYAVGTWLPSRRSSNSEFRRQESRRLWAAFSAVTFAYALYGPFLGLILDRAGRAVNAGQTFSLSRVADQLAEAYRAVLAGYSTATLYRGLPAATWLLAATGVLVVAGAIGTWRIARRRSETAALLLVVLLPYPLAYAAAYTTLTPVHPKPQYLLLMSVPMLAFIAIAAARFCGRIATRNDVARCAVYAITLSVFALPMGNSTWNLLNRPDKRDWRSAMTFLAQHAGTNDAFAVISADTVPASYHPAVGGKGRYGLGWARFVSIDLDTARENLSADAWSRSDNTVWIVGIKDRLYAGSEQLRTPEDLPSGIVVHDYDGVFVVGVLGAAPAVDRLRDALGIIVDKLPDRSAVVAPHLFRSRLLLADGRIPEARLAFFRALQQCRSPEEAAIFTERYMRPKLAETALSNALSR